MRADDIPTGPVRLEVITQDLAPSARDEPLNPRGKRVRDRDFDKIDRFEQNGLAFRQCLLDCLPARRLERLVPAVDGVELAGDQVDRKIDDWKSDRPVA